MASIGHVFLLTAFAAAVIAVASLLLGARKVEVPFIRAGQLASLVTFALLLACCGILVYCFMIGDNSIMYVLEERSLSTGGLAWLYKLAGLWAGRAGSLLFWTFLISLFGFAILARARLVSAQEGMAGRRLDAYALAIVQIVVAIFIGVLLFSSGNMPFEPTPERFFTADGSLTTSASAYGMNQLLEHWAMAIHPPTLFVGYAGLTIPFAYAMAALASGDPSDLWVRRSQRFVLVSWLFLGVGIGLGAVWAYVVLGWGGYWGWDPVENASLLSWLICVALVHTFTVYRQRGAFKRWAVMCACLAFTFVIVATFITRSGIVQSVHAFSGDPVSLTLFGGLIAASLIIPAIGIVLRWKQFGADTEGADDIDSMLSRNAAYYFNNVIMVVFALLLTYMTLAPALPRWMPFGGDALSSVAYEAIARPLGIFYLFILAFCPLLAWGRTDMKAFLRHARIPSVCAVVLFALLAAWWATQLLPVYNDTIASGTANAATLIEAGPPVYYNALAVIGLFVACLLFFNALFMFVRNVKTPAKRAAAIGGGFAHIAMAVILIGLIGSSMYVYEQVGYVPYDEATDTAESFQVREYTLEYTGNTITDNIDDNNTVLYEVSFDVYKDGRYVGAVHPEIQLNVMTQQQKLNAAVIGFPEEDLFVVYHGVNAAGAFSLDVRINPLIAFVWIGFGMLMLGTLFALIGRREPKKDAALAADNEAGAPTAANNESAAPTAANTQKAE